MSLNTSHQNGGLLIYNGEMILLFCKEVEFTIEANQSSKEMKGTKKGQLFLTSHRVVFLAKNQKDPFKSFTIPFSCMDKVELEQPVLGANYIRGHVIAQPNGNWEGAGVFKISFNTGGAIEFGRALLNAAQIMARAGKMPPPPYVPPPPPYNQANPSMYVPPPNANFGFQMPTQMFPPNQINEPVMYANAPPPYPGLYPTVPNASYPSAPVSNAYYDPQNPQNVYVPALEEVCGFSRINKVNDCSRFMNIYGGSYSIPHSWPWMINIMLKKENSYEPFCGGTIISNRAIITAAHCLNYKNATTNFVLAHGIHDLTAVDHKKLMQIHQVILHPNYNPENADSDIAIIILKISLTFDSRISSICLPNPRNPTDVDNKGCYATGWGSTALEKKSSKLRQVCLPVIPWSTCKGLFAHHFTTNMLCAGDINNGLIDTCDGDSGGPLACRVDNKWTLYGIISWGFGCGHPRNPGIFTKVDNFVEWITTQLQALNL